MWNTIRYVCIKKLIEKVNYGLFTIHQTSSMCNPNIQNNILNWLNNEIKKYENFKNAGGGGGSQLGRVVGVENPKIACQLLLNKLCGRFFILSLAPFFILKARLYPKWHAQQWDVGLLGGSKNRKFVILWWGRGLCRFIFRAKTQTFWI